MKLTFEQYNLQLNKIQEIFEETMKQLFTNPCSWEDAELHLFFMQKSKDCEVIFFDTGLLSKKEIQQKSSMSNVEFIKFYIKEKTGREKCLLEELNSDCDDIWQSKIYGVFLSECLDNNHGVLIIKCFFERLAEQFSKNLEEQASQGEQNTELGEKEKFVQVLEIVTDAEIRTERYLKELFAPFNFHVINGLAGEYYEKAECRSNLVLLPFHVAEKLQKSKLCYYFEDILLCPTHNRLIRKLLQMTQDDLYLVLGADESGKTFSVIGICDKKVLNEEIRIPFVSVKIKKHMEWDFFLDNMYILSCQNGHYKVNRSMQERYLLEKLTKYFGAQEGGYDDLIANILKSTKQGHGTMLVIMKQETALAELKRLGESGFGYKARFPQVQTQIINSLNSIDGSIILDTRGRVYGIGMILDGLVSEENAIKGDMARGARYNSAIKYCDYLRKTYTKRDEGVGMILVVSEDEFVNIITA